MNKLAIATLRKEIDDCKLLITKYTNSARRFKMGGLIDDLYENPDELNQAILICKRQINANLKAINTLRNCKCKSKSTD